MPKSSLKNLLESIQASIAGAQEMMQQQHIQELKKFFNGDGSPITQKMKFPHVNNNGETKWTEVDVPLMVLSPPSSLRIKKLKVSFDAFLSGMGNEDDEEKSLHLHVGGFFRRGAAVKCEIQFEGTEPPEGWMRINDELVKVIP